MYSFHQFLERVCGTKCLRTPVSAPFQHQQGTRYSVDGKLRKSSTGMKGLKKNFRLVWKLNPPPPSNQTTITVVTELSQSPSKLMGKFLNTS